MQDLTITVSERRLGLFACCLFIALAACIIPYPGVQTDEALFTSPLYHWTDNDLHSTRFPPLMVIGYIGSLKTYLYLPILKLFGTGVWTLRLPVVFIGAVSIFIFFDLTASVLGCRAALLAALVLATDPIFLLTNTIDWGPVALEHLLLLTGCWCLYRFGSQPSENGTLLQLSFGFFCFGLALWNKAVFVWALSGVTVGALLVFWPELRERATRRNLTYAAIAFLVGASPLLAYNLRHFNATLRGNAQIDPASLPAKWTGLDRTLNGSGLFGFMVSEESAPNPKVATSVPGRIAVWIREHLGEHRQTGFDYVCGALLLAVPWWWRSKAARFSLVATATSWIAMASTHDAGAAAHHLILLWPWPILFAASALASLPWRPILILGGGGMVVMNLLVVNQYISQFERNGPAVSFSDAIFPLSASLPEEPSKTVYVADWDISEPVSFLHQGRLAARGGDPSVTPETAEIRKMMTDPQGVFVSHVPGQQFFPHYDQSLESEAQASKFHKDLLTTIPDSNGRPVFEVFHFVPD